MAVGVSPRPAAIRAAVPGDRGAGPFQEHVEGQLRRVVGHRPRLDRGQSRMGRFGGPAACRAR